MAVSIQGTSSPTSDPIIGIDLGTTHSLVAYVRDGKPEVLPSREGKSLLPSVISFSDGESPVLGYSAKRNKVRNAPGTVFSVKRLLGRTYEDIRSMAEHFPYEVLPGDGPLRVRIGERAFTAIEISAMILRELKLSAEQALGTSVRRAVITVPAYFNDSQRQATRAAGRLAGLDVLRIVNEPTAASLAYGLNQKREGLIAVYDLGGGTFDVSILKLHDGIFEVLATNGNTALGGDDLDQAIASRASVEIREQTGIDCRSDASLRAALLESAENLKIALSEKAEADFEINLGKETYRRGWTRQELEDLIRPILDQTREPCLNALKDAGLQASELTDVILVGGPTRLGVVQAVAQEIFGRAPNTSLHPDEVVALGAAIQADILAGNNRDFLLLDVVPLSLGLETYGGLMSTLIPRNTRIPAVARETFTTFVDKQTGVDIHVLQGERDKAGDNRSLARFKLKGIQPQPAGLPRIEVAFLIDADGILQVAAKDLRTGNEQSIEVRPSYGLTDDEVERMLMAGLEGAESDVAYRKWVEAQQQAETVLRATEPKLDDAFRVLPQADAEQISERVEGLKRALTSRDPQKVQQATTALSQSTVRLAEILLKEAIHRSVDKE